MEYSQLRKGMWLVDPEGRVGIGVSWDMRTPVGDPKAPVRLQVEFHAVRPSGETASIAYIDAQLLTQARFKDIPPSRRPDQKTAAKFGYR